MPDASTNRATNRATDRATNRGGNAPAAVNWRDDVRGVLLDWRWGQGETTVSSNLDSWEDTVSADVATAPGASQRPTPHADGDGWEFDSANSSALYTATPDAQAAAISTAERLSVHARIKIVSLGSNQIIWSVAEGGDNASQISFKVQSTGQLSCGFRGSGGTFENIVASTALTAGVDYIVSLTVGASDVKLFINGTQDGSTGTRTIAVPSMDRCAFGVMARLSPAFYADMKISEVLVSDVEHSGAEVSDIYANMAADY